MLLPDAKGRQESSPPQGQIGRMYPSPLLLLRTRGRLPFWRAAVNEDGRIKCTRTRILLLTMLRRL